MAEIIDKIPFSSARKYSAVTFKGGESYSIGAPHFVPCPISDSLEEKIREKAKNGERVLLLVKLSEGESELISSVASLFNM